MRCLVGSHLKDIGIRDQEPSVAGIASLAEDNQSLLSPSIFCELYSKIRRAKNLIVANIQTASIQGAEIHLHLLIGSREAPSADEVRLRPSYSRAEIALRIAKPLRKRGE